MAEEFENINEPVEEPKEKLNVEEIKENIKEKAEDLKEKAEEFKEKAEDKFDDFKEKAGEKAEEAKEAAKEAYDKVKSEIDDYTEEIDPEDIKKNKLMAILAYIGILVLIPIICAKDSKFAKFHANQGLVLFIGELICSVLCTAKLIGWVFGILDAVIFVFAIIGIVYVCQGKAKELPIIGNIKILK